MSFLPLLSCFELLFCYIYQLAVESYILTIPTVPARSLSIKDQKAK